MYSSENRRMNVMFDEDLVRLWKNVSRRPTKAEIEMKDLYVDLKGRLQTVPERRAFQTKSKLNPSHLFLTCL